MVLEIAEFTIQPASHAAFEEAIERGVRTIIAQTPGFRRYEVQRGIESPQRYLLFIEWETLENHMVDFRGSPAFVQWRAIIGPFFARAPMVEHFERAGS